MAWFGNFFRQSSWYVSGYLLITLLGLISFPVWTRVLSVEEYGILNLVDATIGFVGVVAVFGIPRASLRFYSEFDSGKRDLPTSAFYTTLLSGILVLGVVATALYFSVISLLGAERIGDKLYRFLKLSGWMLLPSVVMNVYMGFVRVEQKAKFHAVFRTIRRYVGFALSLFLVIGLSYGLAGIYYSAISLGYIVMACFTVYYFRQKKIVLSSFSLGFLVESIRYGFPLISADLANSISAIGDRYILQFFMGTEAVGLYSAGYGVTTRLTSLMSVMLFSVTPLYLEMWEEKGKKETEDFLSSVLDFYLMIALPGIVLFSFYGGELLTLLASEKYYDARTILPYLIVPLALHGAIAIYTAGIYIYKKTKFVLYFTLGAGILNIILNFVLVPYWGLLGAAVATLISYTFLIFLSNYFSSRFISLRLNYVSLVKYTLASFLVVFLLQFIQIEIFLGVVIKLAVGILLYFTLMAVVDQRIRDRVRLVLSHSGFGK